MSNDYYTAPTNKAPLDIIRSTEHNANNLALEEAFEKLPDEDQIARSQYGIDSSTVATLYVVTVPTLTAGYFTGLEVVFEATLATTGAANLQLNGSTIVEFLDAGGLALTVGSILPGQLVTAIYTTDSKFRLQFSLDTGEAAGIATAAAVSALASKVAAEEAAAETIAILPDEVSQHFYRSM